MLPGSETAKGFAVFIKAYIKIQMLGYIKKKNLSHSSFFIKPSTTNHCPPSLAWGCSYLFEGFFIRGYSISIFSELLLSC